MATRPPGDVTERWSRSRLKEGGRSDPPFGLVGPALPGSRALVAQVVFGDMKIDPWKSAVLDMAKGDRLRGGLGDSWTDPPGDEGPSGATQNGVSIELQKEEGIKLGWGCCVPCSAPGAQCCGGGGVLGWGSQIQEGMGVHTALCRVEFC